MLKYLLEILICHFPVSDTNTRLLYLPQLDINDASVKITACAS